MKKIKADNFLVNKKKITDLELRLLLEELLKKAPMQNNDLMQNISIFLDRRSFSRILMFIEYFNLQKNLSGDIALFGSHFGRDAIILLHLMQNITPDSNKKIYVFDTFAGIVGSQKKEDKVMYDGSYKVKKNFYEYFSNLCQIQNQFSKFQKNQIQIIKGDVRKTFPKFLNKNKHLYFSFLYFDMDIYAPTHNVLNLIGKKHLHRGSIIAFDEFQCDIFKGESLAFRNWSKKIKKNFKIFINSFSSRGSYVIMD